MSALASLWLPILLSAVVVFIISSLVHMVLNWHAADYGNFDNEDAIRDAIRASGAGPGRYVIPRCKEMKDMGTPEMRKKYEEGPVGHVTLLRNGMPNMGKYLGAWFLLCLLVSATAAFLAVKAHPVDPAWRLAAAKLIGAIAFVGYGFGTLQESIWMGRPLAATAKYLVDAALYALGTAAVFYFLWR